MPPEKRLGLNDDDGLSPRREPGRGKEKAKSVSQTQTWLAGATASHVELVAEGGVLDDELASSAAAEVGGNLERLDTSREWGEPTSKSWNHGCGGHDGLRSEGV
jgi:hypothetical protein